MAWGRLALIQAAGEDTHALNQVATLFGYEKLPEKQLQQPKNRPDADGWMPEAPGQQPNAEEQTVTQVARKPARFLRVNKVAQLNNPEQAQRPPYLDDPKMRLSLNNPQPGTYSFAVPRLLMPLSRLLPFLLNSLGRPVMNGRIDHRKLARLISQGRPLQRLPYRWQQRWPQRLHIITDCRTALEPFWPDFESLVTALKKLLGEEAVDAVRLDDGRLDRDDCLCIAWPGESNHHWRRWQPPAVDTSILILSDLGEAGPDGHAQIRWQRFTRRLQTHVASILTLSPARQSPENRLVCRLFRPNPFNDWLGLPRHPGRDGFARDASKHEQSREKLNDINDILAQLSVLPLIDSGLLRRLRDALQWGDSALESVIWNHPDMHPMGPGIRLKESAAKFYQQRYQQKFTKSDTARKIWAIVEDHHQAAFAGLKQLEKFNQCLLEDTLDEGMLSYMRSLCATLAQPQPDKDAGRHRALQQQCRTILASGSHSLWTHQNQAYRELGYQLFAFAYEDEIRSGKWPRELEAGFDPAQLQWLFDEKQRGKQMTWLVSQTGDQGQFVLLQQDKTETGGETVIAPIYSLQAQAQIPPILTLPSGARIPVQQGTPLNVPHGQAIELHTPWQRLELEATEKPAWAHAMFRDDNQLRAMTIADTTHQFTWMSDQTDHEGASVYRWINQNPQDVVQSDEYGLYFDWVIHGVTQRFRWINPGTFQMGSPETEVDRSNDELLHEVAISQGFWLADTACTQALWEAVMGENPARFTENSENPVEEVSWDDVQAFIKVVRSQFAGLQLRLPTEAEWEYACRAGTDTPFSFGDNITTEQVNYDGNYPYAGGKKGVDRSETVAVKSLPANRWGLYEMHGNVWEWCQDWYGGYPAGHVVDPQGPQSGDTRVVRGGSWDDLGRGARSASRCWVVPGLRYDYLGFRLALGHVEPGRDSHDGQPLRDEAEDHHEEKQQGIWSRLIQMPRKKP